MSSRIKVAAMHRKAEILSQTVGAVRPRACANCHRISHLTKAPAVQDQFTSEVRFCSKNAVLLDTPQNQKNEFVDLWVRVFTPELCKQTKHSGEG